MAFPLVIRGYQKEDWTALCDIHDAARMFELRASGLAGAFLSLAQTAESEGLFDGKVWVACAKDAVLGFAAACDQELTWLYVAPQHMRKGVGRALLHACIAECGPKLSTECLLDNAAALALYQQCGFEITRRVDGRLTGNEAFAASGYLLQRPAQADLNAQGLCARIDS